MDIVASLFPAKPAARQDKAITRRQNPQDVSLDNSLDHSREKLSGWVPERLPDNRLMAVISRQRSFIFLHAPKTAGTSIADALAPWSDVEVPDERMHLTLDECLDYLSEAEIRAFRKIMVARNTWDRVASAYWHHLRAPMLEPEVHRDISRSGLAGFIRRYARPVWMAQTRWLDFRKQRMPVEILRFEKLESDFDAFCRSMGVTARLRSLNRTDGRPPVDVTYTMRTRRLVASVFADEIEEFGFQPPPTVSAKERDARAELFRRGLIPVSNRTLRTTTGRKLR